MEELLAREPTSSLERKGLRPAGQMSAMVLQVVTGPQNRQPSQGDTQRNAVRRADFEHCEVQVTMSRFLMNQFPWPPTGGARRGQSQVAQPIIAKVVTNWTRGSSTLWKGGRHW